MASFLSKQAYKGTRDFYPEDMRIRNWIFEGWKKSIEAFGFEPYDGPMLESFELYAAKSGEELVRDQLYHFVDRGERKVAIRPEMTPTMARMVAGKLHELPKPIRWYSIPNLWRYENPQRGRLREHWQLNVDLLGGYGPASDFEILEIVYAIMERFKGQDFLEIKVNHRALMDAWIQQGLGLSAEQSYKLYKAIDSMAKVPEAVFLKKLADLGMDSKQIVKTQEFLKADDLKKVCEPFLNSKVEEFIHFLDTLKNSYLGTMVKFDPTILRGLDYYTGFVFEAFDKSPENRRALMGGGRYDNLIGLFGKDSLSGVGFGMGDVTFRDFLETHGLLTVQAPEALVYVGLLEVEEQGSAQQAIYTESMHQLCRSLRSQGLRVIWAQEPNRVGNLIKAANRKKARFIVFQGSEEKSKGLVVVKDLDRGQQESLETLQVGGWILSRK